MYVLASSLHDVTSRISLEKLLVTKKVANISWKNALT